MRNLTYGEAKSVIARALGMCATDARVLALCNEAEDRLLNREDDPVGALVPYEFCSSDACLVLPRQVRTVVNFSICDTPGVVLPLWYRMHQNGPGNPCVTDTNEVRLLDRGIAVAFSEVLGENKYVRVYAQNAADAGKRVVLRYYRGDTRQKHYSTIDGVVQEGEAITLVAPPSYAVTSTTVMAGGLYGVIKDVTAYPINLYEYDGTTNTQMLAWYEPSETVPTYRKVYLPGLSVRGACSSCGDDSCEGVDSESEDSCEQTTVSTLVKLQHVPVVVDNDPLVIGNVAALKLMATAIQREEQERFDESERLEAKAMRELRGELASYHGAGEVLALQVQNRATFGLGGVEQLNGFNYGYW